MPLVACEKCGLVVDSSAAECPHGRHGRSQAAEATRRAILPFARLGAMLGAFLWLAYLHAATSLFDDPTLREPLIKIGVTAFHLFIGAGCGLLAGVLLGGGYVLLGKPARG